MKKTNKKDSSNVVLVKNLPFSAKQEDVSQLFEEYGTVTSVNFDLRQNGLFKGSAQVSYERSKDARKAMEELDGTDFFDRNISVEMAQSASVGIKESAEPMFVFVRGLPDDVKNEELDKLFKHCGRLSRVEVPRQAGKSLGYAFIEVESQDSLRKALRVNGARLRKTLKISVVLGDPSRRRFGGGRRNGRRARGRRF